MKQGHKASSAAKTNEQTDEGQPSKMGKFSHSTADTFAATEQGHYKRTGPMGPMGTRASTVGHGIARLKVHGDATGITEPAVTTPDGRTIQTLRPTTAKSGGGGINEDHPTKDAARSKNYKRK